MNEELEDCNKCLGTGENFSFKKNKNDSKCPLCKGEGQVPNIINTGYINEKLIM